MDACKAADKEIPHFCYHERLSVAGNCRMCLVEVEGAPKPVASCHWPAADGMKVKTKGQITEDARKGTMEFLLANHPLDCPICDQGGECDLQDQAVAYGSDVSHFDEMKRAVDDKDIGEKIKTVMTRCIHCTRCVRFATEVAGIEEFGGTGRGENMQIGTYVEKALTSELAGNMIDLCPVGALTSKPYAFTARPWELTSTNSIDMTDPVNASIRIDTRAGEVMRILPRENAAVNEEWLPDIARFSYDALTHNRLTTPLIKNQKTGKFNNASWEEAFAKIKSATKKAKPTKTAGLMGAMHTAEEAYAFSTFMKNVLKTDNLDCRSDASNTDATVHAGYIMNTPLEKLPNADAILLIGCNPRQEAPLVNTRLRQAVQKGAKVATIGSADINLTYTFENLGDSPKLLEELLDGKHKFAKVLQKAERPILMISSDVLSRKDGAQILFMAGVLAQQFDFITPNWNGFNVLQNTPGRVSALDMTAVPTAGGLTTAGILTAAEKGKLDVLMQYGDINNFTKNNTATTVYIGTHLTAQAKTADIILPAATYTEKDGLSANCEGRIQEIKAAAQPPLNAKPDWKIFRALSEVLGQKLPFDSLNQLRELVIEHCPAYARVGKRTPAPWPKGGLDIGKAGSISTTPLTASTTAHYLSNSFLQQSPTMHKMQTEADNANNQKGEAA